MWFEISCESFADDILFIYFFIIFLEKIKLICPADDSHEMSSFILSEKKKIYIYIKCYLLQLLCGLN